MRYRFASPCRTNCVAGEEERGIGGVVGPDGYLLLDQRKKHRHVRDLHEAVTYPDRITTVAKVFHHRLVRVPYVGDVVGRPGKKDVRLVQHAVVLEVMHEGRRSHAVYTAREDLGPVHA